MRLDLIKARQAWVSVRNADELAIRTRDIYRTYQRQVSKS